MSDRAESQTKPRHRKRLTLGGLAIIVVLSITTIIAVISQQPAVGKVLPATQTVASQKKIEFAETRGQYIAFTHPEDYSVVPDQQQKTNGLEQYILTNSGVSTSAKLTVIVYPYTSLDQTPGYQLRNVKKENYTHTILDGSTDLFAATDAPELTAFVRHGTYVASIALAMSNQDDLETTMQQIIASVDWLK